MLIAKWEQPLKQHVKKYYWIYLILALIGIIAFFKFSLYAQDTWSYYGEDFGADYKVLRRWGCLASQMLASSSFVFFVFLAMMKVKIENRVLAFFGKFTLEVYLVHGIFVEIFGYDFLEVAPSIHYIRDVPTYVLVVMVCTIGTVLFVHAVSLLGKKFTLCKK